MSPYELYIAYSLETFIAVSSCLLDDVDEIVDSDKKPAETFIGVSIRVVLTVELDLVVDLKKFIETFIGVSIEPKVVDFKPDVLVGDGKLEDVEKDEVLLAPEDIEDENKVGLLE